ncbi:MAG TPA: lysophospholipid acyltransferase family protein [Jatrophihabitantaceae bacterium]|jgi:1-acyl-sn-glycerol-3-phosphate acyltransferase
MNAASQRSGDRPWDQDRCPARMPWVYRVGRLATIPLVRWWGRLQVSGADQLPTEGPVLLLVNHDSAWDPVIVGVAVRSRPVLALARSSLWDNRLLGWILDRMGQIPIERGRADLTALSAAVAQLRLGRCVGVFPEGTVSRGRTLRPHSGAGRLALAVPEARVVCVAVTGAVELVRFPHRPRIRAEFFTPAGGPPGPDESAIAFTRRATAEIRARAPHVVPGRARKAAKFARLAAEHDALRSSR